MSKFIITDSNNRVIYVRDSDPGDNLGWIEVQNDNVQEHWHLIRGEDASSHIVEEHKTFTDIEVRKIRDAKLLETDWMVLEDSPYQRSGQETNLATIKTYRQDLRDFPQNNSTVTELTTWPELILT